MWRKRRSVAPSFKNPPPYNPLSGEYAKLSFDPLARIWAFMYKGSPGDPPGPVRFILSTRYGNIDFDYDPALHTKILIRVAGYYSIYASLSVVRTGVMPKPDFFYLWIYKNGLQITSGWEIRQAFSGDSSPHPASASCNVCQYLSANDEIQVGYLLGPSGVNARLAAGHVFVQMI